MCADCGLWFGMLSFWSKGQQHGGGAKIRLDCRKEGENDGSGCERNRNRGNDRKRTSGISIRIRGVRVGSRFGGQRFLKEAYRFIPASLLFSSIAVGMTRYLFIFLFEPAHQVQTAWYLHNDDGEHIKQVSSVARICMDMGICDDV